MNGEPLPKIHGGPLRLVVTGYIGARSCKWVYRINATTEPSFGPVQRQEYLYYNQQIGKHNVLVSNGFSIQAMPVSYVSSIPTPHSLTDSGMQERHHVTENEGCHYPRGHCYAQGVGV